MIPEIFEEGLAVPAGILRFSEGVKRISLLGHG